MNSGTKRSENYCLMTDNQKQILVQYFNDGMRSTLDTEKISEASKVAGLSVQRKWIGNHKAKEIRKASRGEEDPGEDNEAEKKRFKGERKISARSMFYRNLSREGRLKGFKNNAERNKFFAREWELADNEIKKTMEEEAEKFNRYELNEMNEEEMAFLVKQHKKKLLHQISTLESLGVEMSIMLLDGPKLENFGSARGLAFLYAHPSLNADFKKFYDVGDENEKKTYTYKDLQAVFNEAYAEAVKIDNARVPYLNGAFEIEGLPEGINWRKANGSIKKPTDYGHGQIQKIMENHKKIKFLVKINESQGAGIGVKDKEIEIPPCLLKLVDADVAERALNGNGKISQNDLNVIVKLRDEESRLLLQQFGHFFDESAINSLLSTLSLERGVILPIYTKRKGKFWLFYYEGNISEIDNAEMEASIPGKWLDNKTGNRYKLLPQPTSIKKLNIVSDKDGLLLFFCHFFEDDDDIVEVKSDFVKDVQMSLKALSD
ncbi:uncharacterized protein LOC135688637 isoform X2 [Rhopilema esculentum]|uniref:uncharacterized protein LOC135688637 isoform X2 n=1 Tax=Rhopilema esculentum TaxID=499914 RepID=UPI0031D1CEA7